MLTIKLRSRARLESSVHNMAEQPNYAAIPRQRHKHARQHHTIRFGTLWIIFVVDAVQCGTFADFQENGRVKLCIFLKRLDYVFARFQVAFLVFIAY